MKIDFYRSFHDLHELDGVPDKHLIVCADNVVDELTSKFRYKCYSNTSTFSFQEKFSTITKRDVIFVGVKDISVETLRWLYTSRKSKSISICDTVT